jgi:hypothetical protein
MMPSLLVGAACLLLFSPWMIRLGASVLAAKPAEPAGVTFHRSMLDLANVRKRLVATAALDEKAKAAIDTLTLALVAGSDK